jgi:SAM-dependent methyltransferase
MHTPNYLPDVKAQYEQLPYPPCNPEDDQHRLMRTWLDSLPMINHYCFAGRQTFQQGFRALVAGGGTGDTTIYLAEQLRNTDAQIVHLDLSAASIAIAQRRAAIRRGGATTVLQHKAIGATLVIDAGRYSGMVFRHIDGMRTFADIFELVRAHPACRANPPDDATLFADFRPAFEALNAIERILLRHVSCRY